MGWWNLWGGHPAEWTLQAAEAAFSECLYFVNYYKLGELRQRAAGTIEECPNEGLIYSNSTLLYSSRGVE